MKPVNIQEERLEKIELLGHKGYFTELRADKKTIPEGMYCYELRHGDDDGFPASIEKSVRVNFFGTVILMEELELGEDGMLELGYDDFGYTGVEAYLPQALGGHRNEKQ